MERGERRLPPNEKIIQALLKNVDSSLSEAFGMISERTSLTVLEQLKKIRDRINKFLPDVYAESYDPNRREPIILHSSPGKLIELDPELNAIYIGSIPILTLSPEQTRILFTLANTEGRVVGYEELFGSTFPERLYDPRQVSSKNLVIKLVNDIRRRFEDVPELDGSIITVKNQGYRYFA